MNNIKMLAIFSVLSCLVVTTSVSAKQADLASKVKACSEIADNQTRLSCYDQLNDKRTSVAVVSAKPSLTDQQVDSFAKEQVKKTKAEKIKEVNTITLTIDELSKTLHGYWKITFTNGQKWQQKDSTRLKLKQGEQVTLTKGTFGAIYLKKENANKRIKVKRLK